MWYSWPRNKLKILHLYIFEYRKNAYYFWIVESPYFWFHQVGSPANY